jgi:hypothetical protein
MKGIRRGRMRGRRISIYIYIHREREREREKEKERERERERESRGRVRRGRISRGPLVGAGEPNGKRQPNISQVVIGAGCRAH